MRTLIILMLCISLQGCAALSALSGLAGGTSSKGHGNDNELNVGQDVGNNKLNLGTDHLSVKSNTGHVKRDTITNSGFDLLDISVVFLFALICGLIMPSVVPWNKLNGKRDTK